MPRVSIYPGGTSGGFAGTGRTANDGGKPRDAVKGWSAGSARRLVSWLWSVDPSMLGDDGLAVTLTMGGRPDSAQTWHRARKQLMERLSYRGATSQHWVVEWTAKGRPHLHMAVYGSTIADIVVAWLDICRKLDWPATYGAQHIVPITGAPGWLEYLAKHASRGVAHYQRQGMAEGWEKSGRLWGHWGDWPVMPPVEVELTDPQFWRYRRALRRYQVARLRNAGAFSASRKVGRRHGDREKGRMMGTSGWVPEDVSYRLLMHTLGSQTAGIYEWEKEENVDFNEADRGGHRCLARFAHHQNQNRRPGWSGHDDQFHDCRWPGLHG